MAQRFEGPNPACKLTRAADQSINNVSSTAVSFDTVTYESHAGMGATGTQLKVQEAGIYHFVGQVGWESASGGRQAWIKKNGAGLNFGEMSIPARTDGGQTHITVAVDLDMQPGDYVELYVYQNSGGSVNLEGSAASASSLSCYKVSELNVP